METVQVLAISSKGKSRLGKKPVTMIVEQNYHDKLFAVLKDDNGKVKHSRWILKNNDLDFSIINWLTTNLKSCFFFNLSWFTFDV